HHRRPERDADRDDRAENVNRDTDRQRRRLEVRNAHRALNRSARATPSRNTRKQRSDARRRRRASRDTDVAEAGYFFFAGPFAGAAGAAGAFAGAAGALSAGFLSSAF